VLRSGTAVRQIDKQTADFMPQLYIPDGSSLDICRFKISAHQSADLNKVKSFTDSTVPRSQTKPLYSNIRPQRNSIFNMRILLLGGSGATGRFVIDEALQRGHKVTALVRNPSVLSAKEGLNIVKGTPQDAANIESAFVAVPDDLPTAVIVTLGSPKEKGSRVIADAHENLIAAMKKHGVSKIATTSSFGVGSSFTNINFLMRFAISSTPLGHTFADHNLVDEILKKSGLKFVLLRPARLTMGKKAPVQFLGDDGKGMGVFAGLGGISRASVASCLVDAVEKSTWDGTTPVISN
jgi:putative NADH-flavin reductase